MILISDRALEAVLMAYSNDLRKRVVEAVFQGGMSRNAAAERFVDGCLNPRLFGEGVRKFWSGRRRSGPAPSDVGAADPR